MEGKSFSKKVMRVEYIIDRTGWGWMGAAVHEGTVAAVILPCDSFEAVLAGLEGKTGNCRISPATGSGAAEVFDALVSFLEGKEQEIPYPYTLPGWATPFQRAVWETVSKIPYGQTRSYAWVAAQAGSPRGARAVGQAMRRNPVPLLVPCHRVIAADGSIGGFTGGIEIKKRLLKLEGSLGSIRGFRY